MNRILIIPLVFLFACQESTESSVVKTTPYKVELPSNFPPMNSPSDNLLTVEGVELGRKLFYDTELDQSSGQNFSCGSCHLPEQAFSSPRIFKSHSVMSLTNLAWQETFLWKGMIDGSVEDVIRFELEEFFKIDADAVIEKYGGELKTLYGDETFSQTHLVRPLAQFVRTIVSADSKFDRFVRNEEKLSPLEKKGMELFFDEKGDCFHCHGSFLFMDNNFHNTGLDSAITSENRGRYDITGKASDMGKYKTPSLRNIALTAPYMHDGRFSSLEEVVNFYSEGVHFTELTDPMMNHEGGILLNEQEKKAIIAFLHTLTDKKWETGK
ncbi:MAG: c-type cytochrome [Cytophagales bacterium]|nr:c-type cytochrome [Cytophagales bacterium]